VILEEISISLESKSVSKSETLENIKKSIIKSFLDTLILVKLKNNGDFNGYQIVRFIQRKYDLMISPSTVYSVLYLLERRDLIKAKSINNVRVYSLTEKGIAMTEIILNHQEKITDYVSMCLSE
jgi:DNA-binding PadR family transcriptional regulator